MKPVYWRINIILFALLVLVPSLALAKVVVSVSCDHEDWVYEVAEPIEFVISVKDGDQPVKNAKVSWRIGPEKMEAFSMGESELSDGKLTLKSHGLDRPGFLRCIADITLDGKKYRGLATGAYEPYKVKATTPKPDDFDQYWADKMAGLSDISLEPVMEKVEIDGVNDVDMYHISYVSGPKGWRGAQRFYGMLAVPKGEGPFPALLDVPGAGVRPYHPGFGWARKGVIHLTVGIHGIPVNLPDELYRSLSTGPLKDYPQFNLDDRETYYYNRVFMGCKRAVDFIFQLDKFDGKTLGIHGSSQGGALSIITAALDKRIGFVASHCPAMCDHYGYLNNRAGGWPALFRNKNEFNCTQKKIEAAAYYDVVNFARNLEAPIWMGLGFNDETCPPTSMFSAYNSITSEKEMSIVKFIGHWIDTSNRENGNQ